MEPGKRFTVEEVAERFSVSPYTVRELLREGKLRGFKIRNQWRIPVEELKRFEEETD